MLRHKLLFGAALGAMLAASAPAQADPISGAIVAALSWVGITTTTAAVTTFLVGTALSTGLSYLSSALRGTPAGSNFGIQTTLQSGGTVARRFPIGPAMDPGSEAYPARTWGKSGKTPNAYFTRWIALSDLPTSLTGFICNDKTCTYGSGTPDADLGYAIPEYNKGGRDHLWVKFFDGTQTAADSWSVTNFGSDPDYPYGSDQVGYGVAWARVTALIDKDLFSSFPTYKFILGGVSLYDPTKDSSVGGSGSQDWDTPSTWAVSSNPAVAKYNVLRGISYGGAWLYGLQNSHVGCCPLDIWFAAINADDTSIEYQTGVSVAQFRCGGMVSVDTAPADLLTELNKCDNGRLTEAGGVFITRSGAVGTSVMSFTDADLIITEPKKYDPFPGQEEIYTGASATWPDPSQNYAMVDAPAILDDTLDAANGGKRQILAVAYNFVPFGDQVQGLQKFALAEKQKLRKYTAIASPRAVVLKPFDAIALTSTENRFTSKIFEVIPTDQDNLDQGLILTEADPADYDWNPATDHKTYTPVPIVGQTIASQSMVGWAVEAVSVDGDGGKARPGIEVSWGTTDIDDVDGVIIQIRLASSGDVVWSGETPHSVEQFQLGSFIPPADLLGDTDYEVRGQYRPISQRDTDWSSWLAVTTLDIRIGASEIYDKAISNAKLDEALQQFNDFIGANAADVLGRIRKLSQMVGESNFAAGLAVMNLRRQVVNVTGTVSAKASDDLIAATGPSSAIAASITSLQADMLTKASSSAVATLSATVAGQGEDISTNADSITSLTATQGNFSASGMFRVSVATTQSGASATLAMGLNASGTWGESKAGMFMNARNSDGKSQIVFVADQTAFMDNDGNVSALFDSTGAYIKSAVIPTITTDMLGANVVTAAKMDVGAINASDIIADNVVVTGHLQANSVTNMQGDYNASGIPSKSITTSGYPTIIIANVAVSGPTAIQITRDGTGIGNSLNVIVDNLDNGSGTLMLVDTPSAGTHTYSVSESSTNSISHGTIAAIELKR